MPVVTVLPGTFGLDGIVTAIAASNGMMTLHGRGAFRRAAA